MRFPILVDNSAEIPSAIKVFLDNHVREK